MALFNESLEGRFAKLVTTLHSMKGPNPMPQVAPEVQHVIELQDEIDRYNHNFLAGVTRYSSGRVTSLLDATHFSSVQFSNPPSSGILVTVERLFFFAATNAGVTVRLYPGAFTTSPATSFPLDGRIGPTQKSALVNYINNQLVGNSGNEIDQENNPYTISTLLECEAVRGLILPPGGTNGNANCGLLGIQGLAVNTQVSCILIHRERAASPAELRAS